MFPSLPARLALATVIAGAACGCYAPPNSNGGQQASFHPPRRVDARPFLERFQDRHGLGAMPAFSERAISDAERTDLMQYLRALKAHG
jgi:hypothetical protein